MVSAVVLLLFVVLLFLVRKPSVQRKIIYITMVKAPLRFFPLSYSREGFHRHVDLHTPDGEKLGAWVYHKDMDEEDCEKFVLYLHGNAGSRGLVGFLRFYCVYSSLILFRVEDTCFMT